MVVVAMGEMAAPRIAGGHRDGTGDEGPRCRQSPTNTTLGDIGVVAGRWPLTVGGFACARNRSWRQRH